MIGIDAFIVGNWHSPAPDTDVVDTPAAPADVSPAEEWCDSLPSRMLTFDADCKRFTLDESFALDPASIGRAAILIWGGAAMVVEPVLLVASDASFCFNKIRGFSVVNLFSSLFVFFAKIMGRFGSCCRKKKRNDFVGLLWKSKFKWIFREFYLVLIGFSIPFILRHRVLRIFYMRFI